jgi:hypothetical protein
MRGIAITLVLAAAVAWGKPKKACEDYCEDDKATCMKLCKERGGPKVAQHCGMACGDAKKQCETSCKAKKK